MVIGVFISGTLLPDYHSDPSSTMSRTQLIFDSASYNKELRQARQALEAHRGSKPLPPGRLVGSRPSDRCPRAPSPRPGVWSEPTAPFSPAQQAPELQDSRAPSSMACSPRTTGPAVMSHQPALTARNPSQLEGDIPQASPLPEFPRPPTFLPAMISLLEVMAPHSSQVPDSKFFHLVDRVNHTFFSEN